MNGEWREWLEHILPLKFFRTLWDALFPSRFRHLVLEALDGPPAEGYSRPVTFCLGCWLLFAAVATNFPLSSSDAGIEATLSALPTSDRRAVVHALGIDTMASVTIADTGRVRFRGGATQIVSAPLRRPLKRRFGRITERDIAQYLGRNGQEDLALRMRGVVDRTNDRPQLFGDTALLLIIAFAMVPGWAVSHLVLRRTGRTMRETRYVHMYNDAWLVFAGLIPFWFGLYAETAIDARLPTQIFISTGLIGLIFWLVRTPRLFHATHGVSVARVAVAHVAGLGTTAGMTMVVAFGLGLARGLMGRYGF
jgi:hypothetical protein